MSALNLYRRDDAAATEFARISFKGGMESALTSIRDHELRAGRYAEARALYEEHYPELLHDEKPEIYPWKIQLAIDLALVLSNTGEQERANLLLNLALQYIGPETGLAGAQIYALQGEKTKALASLRQALDKGRWVWGAWWYYAEHSPNLDSIRNEPEFQSMMAEIRADMAEQLAQLQEWDANGELAPIPKSLN
jgi:tetratricopeptide (TPR) repeat protein